jgi:hypothetical protein
MIRTFDRELPAVSYEEETESHANAKISTLMGMLLTDHRIHHDGMLQERG